jgi:hypothetical protein
VLARQALLLLWCFEYYEVYWVSESRCECRRSIELWNEVKSGMDNGPCSLYMCSHFSQKCRGDVLSAAKSPGNGGAHPNNAPRYSHARTIIPLLICKLQAHHHSPQSTCTLEECKMRTRENYNLAVV